MGICGDFSQTCAKCYIISLTMNQKGISTISIIIAVAVMGVIAYVAITKKPEPAEREPLPPVTAPSGALSPPPPKATTPARTPGGGTQPVASPTSLRYYLNLPQPESYTVSYKGNISAIDMSIYKSGDKFRLDNRFPAVSLGEIKDERHFGFGSNGYRCRISNISSDIWRCAKTPNQCGDKVYSYNSSFEKRLITEPFPVESPYSYNRGYIGKQKIAGVDTSCFKFDLKSNYIGTYGQNATVCFHPTKFLVLRDLTHVATALSLSAVSDDTFNSPQPPEQHSLTGFCAVGS